MIEDVLATSATILQLAQTIQTKSRDVTLVSNDLVKTLKVASKLPFGIGFVAGLVKKAYVRVHYNVEELDSVFDQTKTRLDVLAPTITYLAVGAGLAREIAREADQSVGHSQQGLFFLSRAIGLGVQDVVGFSQDLAVWQSQVSQDTAAINSSQPDRDVLRNAGSGERFLLGHGRPAPLRQCLA